MVNVPTAVPTAEFLATDVDESDVGQRRIEQEPTGINVVRKAVHPVNDELAIRRHGNIRGTLIASGHSIHQELITECDTFRVVGPGVDFDR